MDAFAQWFAILRELGEVPDVRLLHYAATTAAASREWAFPHEQYDGMRLIAAALNDLGKTLPQLPQGRDEKPPRFLDRFRAVWREVHEAREAAVPWRFFDRTARGSATGPLAHTLFEPDEARAIAERAEAAGARSNSFLLWGLDRAIYPEVAAPSPIHRWAVPVNLRGAVKQGETLANVASGICVRIREGASPADVKNGIRQQLERNAHWGAWDAFRILAYLGAGTMRRYAKKYYAREGHSWVGNFSNVGPFEADAGWLCGIPPVTRTHPVSAAAVNVGGRLALGLQAHPALGPLDLDGIMRRWRAYAEGAPTPER